MRLDENRLAELRRALILDTAPERAFDDISRMLATTLEVPITMVNMLDAKRDWFKSGVGVGHTESPAITSFCEIFFTSQADLIVAEDTQLDARFNCHPLVAGPPFIRFYVAARLSVRGHTLGTLCAYDLRPRTLTVEQLGNLQAMASAAIELIRQRGAVAG